MLIERGQTIVGIPAVEARRILRELCKAGWTKMAFDELEAPDITGAALFRRLKAEGYIERAHAGMPMRFHPSQASNQRLQCWSATVKGAALAKARLGKPMSRAKAEAVLTAFLGRVEEVNADPQGLYWIEWVDLFGSLADPSREAIGDVDLNVQVVGRFGIDEQLRREREAATEAMRAGRRLNSLFDQLGYARNEFRKVLRDRSSLIDLQWNSLPDGAPTVRVYSRTEPARA